MAGERERVHFSGERERDPRKDSRARGEVKSELRESDRRGVLGI